LKEKKGHNHQKLKRAEAPLKIPKAIKLGNLLKILDALE